MVGDQSDNEQDKCSICLGNYTNPKILPCMHNICERPCLEQLLNSEGGNTFRCPLCRHEVPVPLIGTKAFPYKTKLLQTESNTVSETDKNGSICSICLGKYRNPKVLPCSHNFCERPCLQRLINSVDDNEDTFRCPLCRQEFSVPLAGTSAFPYNRDLQRTPRTRIAMMPSSLNRSSTSRPLIQETQFESNESRTNLLNTRQPVYRSISPAFPRERFVQTNLSRTDMVGDQSDNEQDKCSICLGNYTNPKILPCMHNICERPCLEQLLNSVDEHEDTFRCLLCRQEFSVPLAGTSAFPYNRDLQRTSRTRITMMPSSFNRSSTSRPLVQETQFGSNESRTNLLNTRQPVYRSISPAFPRERHTATSTNRRCTTCISSCKDGVLMLCCVVFIVYYVVLSLARIGGAIYFYSIAYEETITTNFFVLINLLLGLTYVLTAIAVWKGKMGLAAVLIFTSLSCIVGDTRQVVNYHSPLTDGKSKVFHRLTVLAYSLALKSTHIYRSANEGAVSVR